jgi:hypothetical protein
VCQHFFIRVTLCAPLGPRSTTERPRMQAPFPCFTTWGPLSRPVWLYSEKCGFRGGVRWQTSQGMARRQHPRKEARRRPCTRVSLRCWGCNRGSSTGWSRGMGAIEVFVEVRSRGVDFRIRRQPPGKPRLHPRTARPHRPSQAGAARSGGGSAAVDPQGHKSCQLRRTEPGGAGTS